MKEFREKYPPTQFNKSEKKHESKVVKGSNHYSQCVCFSERDVELALTSLCSEKILAKRRFSCHQLNKEKKWQLLYLTSYCVEKDLFYQK